MARDMRLSIVKAVLLTAAGAALVWQLQWAGAASQPHRSLTERPIEGAELDLSQHVSYHILARNMPLPAPTYPEVAWLDALQAKVATTGGDCPTDRLLAAEAVSGMENLLLSLQSGLSIARLTQRTFLVPSMRAVHGADVRLADVLDVQKLRKFWHCWVEVDSVTRFLRKARGKSNATAAAAAAGPGPAGALLAGASLTLARHAKTMVSWSGNQAGDRVQQFAAWAVGDAEAAAAPVLRVHRHLSSQMCGGAPAWDESFWRHVRPSAVVEREIGAFKEADLGGDTASYVAVHTGRDLGRYCHRAVSQGFKAGALQDGVRAMCNMTTAAIQSQILPAKGWRAGLTPTLVLASEAWRDIAAGKPRRRPGVARYWAPALPIDSTLFGPQRDLVQGLAGRTVFAPAVEFFLLAQAELAVGNMASRGAVVAANVRAAWKLDTVLAWPEPAKERWPFWECGRLPHCGERYHDARRVVQRHVSCYPDPPRD